MGYKWWILVGYTHIYWYIIYIYTGLHPELRNHHFECTVWHFNLFRDECPTAGRSLHCFHIPSPVGHCHAWPTRANHRSITSHLVQSCSAIGIHVSGWTLDSLGVVYIFAMLCLGCRQSLARQIRSLSHVDAWLCILSSPPHCWASCCHGVYPQWCRPRQTAGKSSHAPCIALLPYS